MGSEMCIRDRLLRQAIHNRLGRLVLRGETLQPAAEDVTGRKEVLVAPRSGGQGPHEVQADPLEGVGGLDGGQVCRCGFWILVLAWQAGQVLTAASISAIIRGK